MSLITEGDEAVSDKHEWIRGWLALSEVSLKKLETELTRSNSKSLGHFIKQKTITDVQHAVNQMKDLLKFLEKKDER